MFNKANVQHANTMSISCCVAYNVFIRCSYKYFHKNELYENVHRHFKIQIIFFSKNVKIRIFHRKNWPKNTVFWEPKTRKTPISLSFQDLSIGADVSQRDTWVLKHRILNYFSYRSVITSLELISLNSHASHSYYRRLLLSIEHNMVFQCDKMTRGWPTLTFV